MNDPQDLIRAAERVAQDVKIAAKVVSDAVTAAETVRQHAAREAAQLLLDAKKNNTEKISNALREVFGEQEEAQRFIDTKRIPLICKDISNMNEKLETIQSNLTWIVRLIIGAVVLALIGLLTLK